MSIVGAILIWLLIGALALILLAGVLPLRIELALHKREAWVYSAKLYLFAGYGPRVLLADSRKKSKATDREAAKKGRKSSFDWQGDPLRFLRAILRLLARMLKHVHVDHAKIDMAFGLGDPADTGQAFGLLAPVVYGCKRLRRVQVHVEPVFHNTVLRGRADLNISLVPVFLLLPLVRFGWSVFGPNT
ncbi:DUF2953 domain-containing protein [Roseobacter sp. YSTF-M11]|uniref:DUF2953 domain-containing protein n=1 Tax=Roseobacter insulae TaxID=2859783 RepID=A0A9X1FSC2_9RHOB|nr:DUF2953 domain-containing protein [Roseobacter insulae]MBW4706820.1 DUF2953 domain-containing protein [Roseobacter insulae]